MNFFLSASSVGALDGTKARMLDLVQAGYDNLLDWTENLGSDRWLWPDLAAADVTASVVADLYVLLPHPMSYGAMLELGARLGAKKQAHVVGNGGHEFFLTHPLVIRHADWQAFKDWLAASERRRAILDELSALGQELQGGG